jgi:Mrp family chromosome partitioning ATPase
MVKELRKKYDFVMFDSRPIEETSDAFVLNKISDQTLYVFQIKKSLKKDLKEIDKCVEKGELNNISIVVNS